MRVFFADTWNRKPSFLFSRVATRKDALADDDGSSQEPDGGEYYENEEYEEEDDSRDYEEGEEGEYEEEFEEDAEAAEEYEEGEDISTMPRTYAIEDDEIEEVVDEFGSEPAEDSERLSEAEMDQYDAKVEGEYEEEETEKDDTDTERIVGWKIPKASKDEDPDRSLGSTVLLPSQPTSFTNKRPASSDNLPSDPERTPVPEDRSRLSGLPRGLGSAQPTLGNSFFGARQPTEAQTTPTKTQASSSVPASPVSENNVQSGDELQTAEMNDSERPPSSPNSIIVIDHSVNGGPEDSEPFLQSEDAQEPVDLGITVEGEDVYNDAVEGARSNSQVRGFEVTEELDELPEASDLVIIEDGEDEESRDDRSTLYPMLPDSVYDRSSIAREFAREATVETVEWDGDTDALSEGVRIALEGVEGSSESGGEPLQSEDPVESNEEVELAEDLDEVEVEEKEAEEVIVGTELDSEDSDREDQSAEESAEEDEPGSIEEGVEVVEQTEEANLHEGVKLATLGINLAGRVETEECQAEELEAGVQADVEDAIDSETDIPDNISEEPVALVGLGHQYNDDDANSAQEPEEKQQNQTPGIEVVVEIDHPRQITPVSENIAAPPQSVVTPAKRQEADAKLDYRPPGSPLSDNSLVRQGLGSVVGDDIQGEDVGEAPPPAKKRIRKHRSKKRRKSGIDPLYVPSPQELEQDAAEETDSDMDQPAAKRQKSKAKSTTTTPAKSFKPSELESDLKAVEAVAAVEVTSAREKREGKVKQGDGSVVPMLTSEEAGIPLGIELRDGKVVQPPP
ncbi:hypothetical protein B9Z19DRAFT_797793 [Tuber borchii]|uniref:Uncharacterized protein n=1 Tax=Tuber borchii TaxID=42251 RepID=A0A2T6ZWB8_TUBBO|nr:hypothetical protein B9Z19DRAFT_797793 [Tuber borchii]